jgi:hypothetical protein
MPRTVVKLKGLMLAAAARGNVRAIALASRPAGLGVPGRRERDGHHPGGLTGEVVCVEISRHQS